MRSSLYFSFYRHSINTRISLSGSTASSLFLFLSPHQRILQPNALPLLVLPSRSPPPSTRVLSHRPSLPSHFQHAITHTSSSLTYTHTHTRAGHKTSRMTLYPSQVHTLNYIRVSFVTRPTTGPLSHFFLTRSLSRNIFTLRFIVCLPRVSRSRSRARRLLVARTIRETGAPFISVTRSLYLSTWPTHRNKFHPPTLPFTHFSPADHPLRIGKQAIRLSRRPIFRRPTDRPSGRKNETKGHFFPSLRPIGCILPPQYLAVITHAYIRKLYIPKERFITRSKFTVDLSKWIFFLNPLFQIN